MRPIFALALAAELACSAHSGTAHKDSAMVQARAVDAAKAVEYPRPVDEVGPVEMAKKPARVKLRPIAVENAKSSHGPFESGECMTCHKSNRAANPGPLVKTGDALCFDCHDDFGPDKTQGPFFKHPEPERDCLRCHNPHNSEKRALLVK